MCSFYQSFGIRDSIQMQLEHRIVSCSFFGPLAQSFSSVCFFKALIFSTILGPLLLETSGIFKEAF